VGIVGRLTPWKGQHIFIRAAAALAPRFPHARFLIVGSALFGETAYESQLRDLVKKLDLSHRVKFTGFRPNVAAIMETLDIAVHASTVAEPFGQVIIEAMAACKPVIATNGGGVPEIMLHGRTGLMVPMNDPDAMAEALSRLLSNPKLAHEMGQHGRRHVEKYFTIQHTSAKVMRCYDQVLARSGSRSIPSPPDSASPLPA
jgi:glycosyltransferase involved in cell wall biosynthesis